jgi:poly(hydroxyalkanoate) depolymerase family esterase
MRRFRLYRPPGVRRSERLPLLVMLHGCGQDARSFARLTRMNRLAARERFLVLYPEQDRLSHGQGCWHWYDTRSGRAWSEVAVILAAIDQVCLLHPADRQRVAVAGLSAGASMAALLAIRHPDRFRAVVMHSGLAPGAADSQLSALGAMQGQRQAMRRVAEGMSPSGRPKGEYRRAQPEGTPVSTDPTRWPPLLVIHGQRDGIVAPDNALAAATLWADSAGARPSVARTVQRGQRHPMAITDYKARGGRLVARQVDVARLGHAWSGAAAGEPHGDAAGPDATTLAWRFVAKQF